MYSVCLRYSWSINSENGWWNSILLNAPSTNFALENKTEIQVEMSVSSKLKQLFKFCSAKWDMIQQTIIGLCCSPEFFFHKIGVKSNQKQKIKPMTKTLLPYDITRLQYMYIYVWFFTVAIQSKELPLSKKGSCQPPLKETEQHFYVFISTFLLFLFTQKSVKKMLDNMCFHNYMH